MNISARVITALVGVPALVFVVAIGRSWLFSALVLGVTVIALFEYYHIVFPNDAPRRIFGILPGALLALGMVVLESVDPSALLVLILVALLNGYIVVPGTLRAKFEQLSWILLGTFYLGYLVPHFALLYRLPHGKEWVFLILLVIMSGDTAGYLVGRLWGKHKLAPELSPNKTVEGAIAVMAAGVGTGLLGGRFLLPGLQIQELGALSLVLAVVGQSGDLFESWIKRVFSVKDSGSILPGHGGILDRMDSLIFPTVFTTYYVRMLHS
jgi:phosphatidate cytidylyltransferase